MLAKIAFFEIIRNIHREQILDLKNKLFTVPTPSHICSPCTLSKGAGSPWDNMERM